MLPRQSSRFPLPADGSQLPALEACGKGPVVLGGESQGPLPESASTSEVNFKRGKQQRLPCFPRSLVFLFTSGRSLLDLSPQLGDNADCLSKASCQPILVGIFGETPCWGENERDLL